MEEELDVSSEYKKAFNEGYVLAKQLGLKVGDIRFSSTASNRFQALQDGIREFDKEYTLSVRRALKRTDSNTRDTTVNKEKETLKKNSKRRDLGR